MIRNIRIDGSEYYPRRMEEAVFEKMEIAFDRQHLSVALPTRHGMVGGYGYDPTRETRAEYGDRLRRAANDAARHVERSILEELNRMGHLV